MMKKALIPIIIVLAIAAGVYFFKQSQPEIAENSSLEDEKTQTPITITSKEIREDNFTGSEPVIEGEGKLVNAAREYIANSITQFRTQADTDVPQMREDWGEDSPAGNYAIEIGASTAEGENTQSIIVTEYIYSGGAHGSSSYKVFTASKKSGEMLSLSDMIKNDKRSAFTKLIKEKLNAWRPAGSESTVVFPEDVADLSFEALSNWAILGDNFVLYFSQYEVGPGVLGAFALPVPLEELSDFLL
ncbi:MAG: DUF3298 and DUF4163 domain-containing protein [bacterium]|nr:DUF3298 and DUF4163 domain-containing protein [bacterium]